MKKQIIILGLFLTSGVAFSQVGINTEEPKATLDIVATVNDPTKIDGLIAPRLTGDELASKDALYTVDQVGAIVYAKSAASPTTTKTVNVTEAGYYYFDGVVWQIIKSPEPWKIQNTIIDATLNTQNIYQNAKVAVGFSNSDAISDKQLDVKGDFRAKNTGSSGTMNLLETNSTLIPDATVSIVADNEDISQMTKYSSSIAQVSSLSNAVTDTDSGQETFNSMMPFSGAYGSYDSNSGTGARLDVISTGTAILGTYNDNTNYDSSISLSPQSAGLIVQHPPTGQAAIFGVNTQSLYFQFNQSAGNIKGAYQFPSNYGKRGQILTTRGAPNDPGNGGQANLLTWRDVADLIVLKAPDGSCYKLTVDNSGSLGTTPDADCTVDSYSPLTYSKTANSGNNMEYSEENISKILQKQNKMIEEQNKVIEKLKSGMKSLNKK